MAKSTELKKVKVTVKSENHTHESQPCKPGDVIEVWEDTADWLVEIGAVEPFRTKAKAKKPDPEGEESPKT